MKSTTLIDTDILIDVGRDIPEAITVLGNFEAKSTLAISVITQMELIVGCQSKQELRFVDKFLSRFEIITINEQISTKAVELLQEYRLSHGLLIADALIAATAIHLNLPFITKNQKDYRFISNLGLLSYS